MQENAMAERTNQEWLTELHSARREDALAELRTLLVRGLRYAMADRPSVTAADIEDFAQDALVKILAALDSFREESRFTTWAQKIAVRVAFSELRRRRWQDVSLQDLLVQHDVGYFTPTVLADAGLTPEQQTTRQTMLDIVQHLIMEELTDRQREAMTAIVIGGMPLEEVARRMETNRNAIYKLLHDARRRLRTRMMAQGISLQDMLAAFGP
jgi:RNA polymerase sigma-70 factor (ECF subfamily)